jgi:hypothetical protein
LAVR